MPWALWRHALHLIYLRADKHLLRAPLGDWHPAKTYHHQWQLNYGQDVLYFQSQDSDSFLGYPEHSFTWRNFQFHKDGVVVTRVPRSNSFPVEVNVSPQYLQVPFKQIFSYSYRQDLHYPEQLWHQIQQLPNSLQQLVKKVERLVPKDTITNCFELQEPIYIASGGGAIPGRVSFGWILQIGTTQIAKGKGPAYGDGLRNGKHPPLSPPPEATLPMNKTQRFQANSNLR
jgi:hypothetical protein